MAFTHSPMWRSLLSLAGGSRLAAIGGLLLAAFILPASAQEAPLLVFGAGAAGIVHHNSHVDHTLAIASVEYRASRNIVWQIKPLAGAFVTSDGTVYGHGGVYGDWAFGRAWNVALHFSVGAYGHGDKNDLCNTLEFQEGVDLMYRLKKGWRLGASMRHLSNGGMGGCNPGMETLTLLLAVPLR